MIKIDCDIFHFESSDHINNSGTVDEDMRCYVCDIRAIDISRLQPQEL